MPSEPPLRDAASVQSAAHRIATVLKLWLVECPQLRQRAYTDLTSGAMHHDGSYSPDWNEVLQSLSNEHSRDEDDLELYRFTSEGLRLLVRALRWKDGPTVCEFAEIRLGESVGALREFLTEPTPETARAAKRVVSLVVATLLGGDLPQDETVDCWRSVTWFSSLGVSAESLKNKRKAKKDPVLHEKRGTRWWYEAHSVMRAFPGTQAEKVRKQLREETG